jgi:hypothetical protein
MRSILLTRTLAAMLLSVTLVACGGGGGGGSAGGTPPVASTPPVVAPPVVTPPVVTPPVVTPPVVTPPPPPPPLAYPIPAGLWAAPASAVPASGNYVYLQSDIGDYIGAGRTYLYTGANAQIKSTGNGLAINVNVQGDQNWSGAFLLPSAVGTLQAGYFSGLTRTPFAVPAVGGVEWSGEGRGCNMITGYVVIDKVTLTDGALTALDLRFEQHCEGGSTALHGQIHWTSNDTTAVPGPQNPPPVGLWTPPTTFTRPSGSYVYLQSDSNDYIGGGQSLLYTAGNAEISAVTNLTAAFRISVGGIGGWTGNFIGMNTLSQLQPGYYGSLERYPFNNAVRGGLDWSGNGRGCNKLSGWFMVDKVTYSMAELTAIDLRFEQHCEGLSPALHGAIHWIKP